MMAVISRTDMILFRDSLPLKLKKILVHINTLYNVCAVPWGVLSTVGVFSTVGDIMSTVGGYLEYRGGVQYRGGIS